MRQLILLTDPDNAIPIPRIAPPKRLLLTLCVTIVL